MTRFRLLSMVFLATLAACAAETSSTEEPASTSGGEGETTVEVVPIEEPVSEPVAEPEPEAPPAPPPLAAHDPVRCAGSEEVTLEGVQIDNADGVAVDANGSCVVRITRCTLRGSTFAIKANGNAQVEINECQVGGGTGAVDARGRSKVRFVSSSVEGDVRHAGRATVEGHEAPAEAEAPAAETP